MPSYKLTYFNITGLGEPIRLLLNYGGVDFEDVRIDFEDWPNHKSKMPMEQMPILEIDGKVFHQARAISRYLAKKFNLYSSDDLEAIEIDASIDDIEDLRLFVGRFFSEKDPVFKAKLKAIVDEKIPFFLKKFEERAKANGGHLVGSKLTWADIHFAAVSELLGTLNKEKEFLEGYPVLTKLYKTVRALPKIKAYLDNRPKTLY